VKGELEPLNNALNKPKTKFGLDYRVFGGCVLGSVLVFLFVNKLAAPLFLIAAFTTGVLMTRKDPKLFDLWAAAFFQQSASYDPGKRSRK
jgi:type IV secretory pathway VirB3-like protein